MRANQANITLLDLQKSFAAQDKVFHQGQSSDSLGRMLSRSTRYGHRRARLSAPEHQCRYGIGAGEEDAARR